MIVRELYPEFYNRVKGEVIYIYMQEIDYYLEQWLDYQNKKMIPGSGYYFNKCNCSKCGEVAEVCDVIAPSALVQASDLWELTEATVPLYRLIIKCEHCGHGQIMYPVVDANGTVLTEDNGDMIFHTEVKDFDFLKLDQTRIVTSKRFKEQARIMGSWKYLEQIVLDSIGKRAEVVKFLVEIG